MCQIVLSSFLLFSENILSTVVKYLLCLSLCFEVLCITFSLLLYFSSFAGSVLCEVLTPIHQCYSSRDNIYLSVCLFLCLLLSFFLTWISSTHFHAKTVVFCHFFKANISIDSSTQKLFSFFGPSTNYNHLHCKICNAYSKLFFCWWISMKDNLN